MQPLKNGDFKTIVNNFRKFLGFEVNIIIKIIYIYSIYANCKKNHNMFALKLLEENT